MKNPFSREPSLNKFLLISVVLHAIVFFTFPEVFSLQETDIPGMAGGGIIQIMNIETPVSTRLSPVTDLQSQSTIPRVTEPKPAPEPQPEAVEALATGVELPEVEQPQVERARPAEVEQVPDEESPAPEESEPVVQPEPELIDEGEGELLTSEAGTEIVVEDPESAGGEQSESETEQEPESATESGSGQGDLGEDNAAGGLASGEGSADVAPPPPGPLPSGRDLHIGGGAPLYPKDAEHAGIEGTIIFVVKVSESGELIDIQRTQSSGSDILDNPSERTIREGWKWQSEETPYSLEIAIEFVKEGYEVQVIYGEGQRIQDQDQGG